MVDRATLTMSEINERAIELHRQAFELENRGELAAAEDACREALTIFEREEGPDSPLTAQVLLTLAGILEREGRFQDAALAADRTVRVLEPLLPRLEGDQGKLVLVHALGLRGTALRQMGEYEAAEKPLTRAVELAEELPAYPDELMGALNNLGVLCKFAGWFDRGEAAYWRALDLAVEAFGKRHELVATLLHNIGGLAHGRGEFQKAEEPLRQAWEIRRELLGEDHPNTLADAVAYAAVLDGLDRHGESLPIYQRALQLYEAKFGPEHYEVAATLHNLAVVEQARGNVDQAKQYCERSLSLKEGILGLRHPDTALSAMNLGAMLLASGDQEQARRHLTHALTVFRSALAEDHPHIELCQELLAAASLSRIE
jgi:tetratricopeptide (TPR) repeat protein